MYIHVSWGAAAHQCGEHVQLRGSCVSALSAAYTMMGFGLVLCGVGVLERHHVSQLLSRCRDPRFAVKEVCCCVMYTPDGVASVIALVVVTTGMMFALASSGLLLGSTKF